MRPITSLLRAHNPIPPTHPTCCSRLCCGDLQRKGCGSLVLQARLRSSGLLLLLLRDGLNGRHRRLLHRARRLLTGAE